MQRFTHEPFPNIIKVEDVLTDRQKNDIVTDSCISKYLFYDKNNYYR